MTGLAHHGRHSLNDRVGAVHHEKRSAHLVWGFEFEYSEIQDWVQKSWLICWYSWPFETKKSFHLWLFEATEWSTHGIVESTRSLKWSKLVLLTTDPATNLQRKNLPVAFKQKLSWLQLLRLPFRSPQKQRKYWQSCCLERIQYPKLIYSRVLFLRTKLRY